MRPNKLLLSLGVMTMTLAGATAARAAQACMTGADCPRGFTCQLNAVPPLPPECAKDQPCATTVALFAPAGFCAPGACATDADCGTDMVCHSQTTETCSGGTTGACAPNTKCDLPPPTEPVCTKQTTSVCAYRWELACNTDGDCGAGFNCVPSTRAVCPTRSGSGTPSSGSSSGAGGSASSGVATTAPTKDEGGTGAGNSTGTGSVAECTTTTAFPGSCQPKAATCAADSDCPSAWTCTELSTGGGTAVGSGGNTGSVEPTPPDQPVSTPAVSTTTTADSTATQKVCVSPYGGVARDGILTSGGSSTGTNGGTGGTTGAPTVAPTEKGGTQATDNAHDTSTAGGCALIANDATGESTNRWSSIAAGMMLVGLVLGARRRTRR